MIANSFRKRFGLLVVLLLSCSSLFSQVTVNPGGGTYVTVNAAFAAINAGTHTGAITIEVSANTTEPAAPTVLNASGVGLANYTSVTMFPTASNVVVAGASNASTAILVFNGADNITINGNINNGVGTSQNLTIQNTTANTNAHSVLWFQSSAVAPALGCNNISIRNVNLIGNANVDPARTSTTPYQTIIAYSSTVFPATTSQTAVNNSNLVIDNCSFTRALVAIHIGQSTAAAFTGLAIRNNSIGSALPANFVIWRAMYLANTANAIIENNNILNIKSIISSSAGTIEIVGATSSTDTIRRNRMEGIYNTSTGGWACAGVWLNGGNNHIIANNIITDLMGANYSSATTTFAPYGIRLSLGTGHKVWYNSIHLFGNVTSGASASTSCALAVSSTAVNNLDIRNNIFSNIQTSSVNGFQSYAIRYASGYNFAGANNIVNNNYYGVGANTGTTSFFVGGTYAAGINYANVPAMQTTTGYDGGSQPILANNPAPFVSNTDLSIPNGTTTSIESGAVIIPALGLPNVDFMNVSRPAFGNIAPDMGAYEFNGLIPNACSGTPTPGQATSTLVNACGNPFVLNLSGNVLAGALSYQWQSSPSGANTWTNLGAAQTSPPFSTTQSVPTDYRCLVTCTNGNSTATSLPVTVGQNPPTNCYCTPLATGTTYWINSVSTTGGLVNITNLNSGLGITNMGYSNYTTTHTVSQIPGGQVTINAVGSGSSTFGWGIYVDWNQDGDFADPGETMFTTPGYVNSINQTITVPMTALPGTTRMRIYNDFLSSTAATGPCGPFASSGGSEAEDYAFLVVANCTTANAGTASASALSICTGNSVVLSTNAIPFTGSSLQWLVASNIAGPYTPVVGGVGGQSTSYTTPLLTAGTYFYRVRQECANCGPCADTSNILTVTVNAISTPSSTTSSQCGPGIPAASVSSTAGAQSTGQFFWYDAPTGGNLLQSPPYGALQPYYFNDFSSPTLGNASLNGNASVGSGVLTITPNTTSQHGAIMVNASGLQSNKYRAEFDLTTVGAGVGNMADGISYSFSDDGVPGIEASMNAENGTGSKLKVAFVAYGAGLTGVFLMYNCLVNEQTPATPGVLAHVNDLTWLNSTKHVTIDIDSLGRATVALDAIVLFNQVQLPPAYLSANRSNWTHIVKGRTGGIAMGMSIDNLDIKTSSFVPGYNTFQSSISSTTTFYVAEMGQTGCQSDRVPVLATVVPPVAASASASPSAIVCPTATVTLQGSGAGVGGSYLWNGNPTMTADTVFSPAAPGTYTVTAIDQNGCSNTATITISTHPVITGSTSASPTSVCVGGSSTLTAVPTPQCFGTTSGFAGIYAPGNWNQNPQNSNGFVNFNTAPISITITSGTNASGNPGYTNYGTVIPCPGTVTFNWSYTNLGLAADDIPRYRINNGTPVNFSGFNTNGSQNQSGSQTITVNAGDSLFLSAYTTDNDAFGCAIQITNFVAPAAPTTGTATFWDAPTGGNNLGASPATVTVPNPGINTFYAEFTTTNTLCPNPIRVPVTVNANNQPIVLAQVSPGNTICEGETATLTAFAPGGGTYTWQGGTTPTTGSPVSASPIVNTVYTVTVQDGNGCLGTATVNIDVNPLPVVSINSTPSAPIVVCTQDQQVTLSGNGANSYSWSGGVQNGVAFTAAAGTTTYTVTGTTAGCNATATIDVTGNVNPTVTISASASNLCFGNTTELTGIGASTYQWTSGPNTANWVLQPNATATYTVTGVDGNACSNTSTIQINVSATNSSLSTSTATSANSQPDGSSVIYTNVSCDLIAGIDDGVGGNVLGNVVATVNVSASAPSYNGQPYVRRWYEITPSNNGPATVTLYIDQSDFANYNTNSGTYAPLPTSGNNSDPNIANIRISQISGGPLGIGTATVITPTANWNGSHWELSFPVAGFSQFYVHGANPGNIPLPVSISSFQGRKLAQSNELNWTTMNEQNNSHFVLQYATDGINFSDLARIDSKAPNGNSLQMLNYSFEHASPAMGHNYYRLLQVDIDAKSTLNAKVVDLIWGANGSTVSVYPNPTKGMVNIDLYTSRAQNTTIKLLDMSGRVVKQIQARSEAGVNKLYLDISDLANGIYSIQLFENDIMTHVDRIRKND